MTVEELMKKVEAELTGDSVADVHRIYEIANEYKKEENAEELVSALADRAYQLLPPEKQQYMREATFVDGVRMDKAFHNAQEAIQHDDLDEAERILSLISEAIRVNFEETDTKWYSFRNPFEYHLFREMYPTVKEFERAPFDFAHYLTLYGYVLLNQHKVPLAAKTVERAIKFNPVNADVRFELAEICKFGNAPEQLLNVCKDTLRVCTSADRIGRTLCNFGYYCNMIGELNDATIFYFESVRFNPSKAVELELQDAVKHMKALGQKFTPPTHGQILDNYEKYGLEPPPCDSIVNLAIQLGESAHEYGRPELEGLFYRVAYDLTREPKFLEILKAIDEKLGLTSTQA